MSNSEQNKKRRLERGHPALLSLFEMSLIAHQTEISLGAVLPDGMSASQFLTLQVLGSLDSPPTISHLAEWMGVTQPTMSWNLRKLENQGWIDLTEAFGDRRAKRVRMTPEGLAVKENSEQEILPYLEKLVGALPEDEWESLHPQLRVLRKNLPERA